MAENGSGLTLKTFQLLVTWPKQFARCFPGQIFQVYLTEFFTQLVETKFDFIVYQTFTNLSCCVQSVQQCTWRSLNERQASLECIYQHNCTPHIGLVTLNLESLNNTDTLLRERFPADCLSVTIVIIVNFIIFYNV